MLPKTAGTLKKHIMECCLNDCSDFKQVKLDINTHTHTHTHTHKDTTHTCVYKFVTGAGTFRNFRNTKASNRQSKIYNIHIYIISDKY